MVFIRFYFYSICRKSILNNKFLTKPFLNKRFDFQFENKSQKPINNT